MVPEDVAVDAAHPALLGEGVDVAAGDGRGQEVALDVVQVVLGNKEISK